MEQGTESKEDNGSINTENGVERVKVRILTVSSMGIDNKETPMIRITGKWLEKLGFLSGKKVMIEERYGQLVLKTVKIENEGQAEE